MLSSNVSEVSRVTSGVTRHLEWYVSPQVSRITLGVTRNLKCHFKSPHDGPHLMPPPWCLYLDASLLTMPLLSPFPWQSPVFAVRGLAGGKQFESRVRACNAEGCSAAVTLRIITPPDTMEKRTGQGDWVHVLCQHRAGSCAYSARTVQGHVHAVPAPCRVMFMQCSHRAGSCACSACTVQDLISNHNT